MSTVAEYHPRDAGQRYSPGVAFQRRHQRHAVFFFAGGRDLQLLLRPDGGRVAADCRRPDLGGVSFCRSGGVESDLGAGDAQSGAGCLPGFAGSAECSVPGESFREFHFRQRAGGADDAAVHRVLQIAGARPRVPVALVALLGTWALVVNGTFFAAMSLRTRSREIMLPLLLFPDFHSGAVGHGEATTAILTGEVSAKFWIVLLAGL